MGLQDLYAKYHDRVQFLMIYIREAHPVDGWHLGKGLPGLALKLSGSKAATGVYDPKTIDSRRLVASACASALQYDIPMLVDEMDDGVNKAYAALPTRLYLVGVDGRVAYAGGPGPFGFSPAKLGAAIERYLAG
ncbi:MAG: hypothetical protein E3J64_04375 [Anaerolineales bacterium]|nr:MAG: hypothetical protein E3J64_04375 [Anaerolineales bacterium]